MLHETLNFLLGWLIPGATFLIGVPLGLWLAIRELWQTQGEVAAGQWPLAEEQEQERAADMLVLKVRGSRVTFWAESSAMLGPSDLN